jgi:hypothetical protein
VAVRHHDDSGNTGSDAGVSLTLIDQGDGTTFVALALSQ